MKTNNGFRTTRIIINIKEEGLILNKMTTDYIGRNSCLERQLGNSGLKAHLRLS